MKEHEMKQLRERLLKDHTRLLLETQNDKFRYKILKEDLELGRGDAKIIPYLMLQYGPHALKPLVLGLKCPNTEMRFQCILALEKLGELGAIKHLIAMFDDKRNNGMEYQLRETIGQLSGWDRMDAVYHALHHGTSEVSYNMARILSEYGDEKLLNHLIRALKKREVDAIAICDAIESWAISLHDRESASAVLSACLTDENPLRRAAAATTLGSSGNLGSASALFNAIRLHPEDKHLHATAGSSLAKIFEEYEDAALKSQLDALLADDTFLGKEDILRILNPEKYDQDENSGSEHQEMTEEKDSQESQEKQTKEASKEPVYTFEEFGWEETHMVKPASGTFEELIEMLGYDNPEVQLAALYALRKLRDSRATTTFNELLPKLTTFYRFDMAEVMGQLEDPGAVPVLSAVFQGAWADLKMAIIRSLNRIGGKGAQKTLLLALHDKIPKVRYLAAWALGERKNPASLKALKKALPVEKSKYVRKQIEASIEQYNMAKPTEIPSA